MAVLAALYRRKKTGEGAYVDLSQITAGLQVTGTAILDYSANGRSYARSGNRSPHRPASPHGVYRTQGEDNWLATAVYSDVEWLALRQVLGNPSALAQPRFTTLASRVAHQDDVDRALEAETLRHDRYALMRALQEAGVAAGVVQKPSDRLEDPQLAADGHFVTLTHPEMGPRVTENIPVRFSGATVRTGGPDRRAAPCLAEHDRRVYGELLGLSEPDLAALRADRVLL
jgi:crotonobetainyl-CoA:carnitine CoA-transferase CaiB-like acyl-CoA transferase